MGMTVSGLGLLGLGILYLIFKDPSIVMDLHWEEAP